MPDSHTVAASLLPKITQRAATAHHYLTDQLDYEKALAHIRQVQADAGKVADHLTMLHLGQEEKEVRDE